MNHFSDGELYRIRRHTRGYLVTRLTNLELEIRYLILIYTNTLAPVDVYIAPIYEPLPRTVSFRIPDRGRGFAQLQVYNSS